MGPMVYIDFESSTVQSVLQELMSLQLNSVKLFQ